MPLSGESRKMAKISDPWRAQFFLGANWSCSSIVVLFYRMKVSPHYVNARLGDGEGFYRGEIHSTWRLRDLRVYVTTAIDRQLL